MLVVTGYHNFHILQVIFGKTVERIIEKSIDVRIQHCRTFDDRLRLLVLVGQEFESSDDMGSATANGR